MNMYEHLIFYDADCPLCHRAVQQILDIDVHRHIAFAPLTGEAAADILIGPQAALLKANSLVLVEDYQSTDRKFWIRSKAVLRTYWLVGNGWGLVGILSFFPSFIGDALYRWLAVHRHQFKLKMPPHSVEEGRFLP